MSETKCPFCGQSIVVRVEKGKIDESKRSVNLTKEQAEKLEVVHADGNGVYMKPRAWLKPEDFKAIADVIKDLGGKWLSQGRESCFLLPNDAYMKLTNKPKEN
jgi:hypothetical protein